MAAARTRGAATLAGICLAAGGAFAQTAQAQQQRWPDKPIKLIVPFQPGTSTDNVARLVGQQLGTALGQTVVIENRVGAAGALGTAAVARSAPDGYTLAFGTTSTHSILPSTNKNLAYDPIKDFAPVSLLGEAPYVVVINPKLSAANLKEFLDLARKNPGKLNYASGAGTGSLANIAGELLWGRAGVQVQHVPYQGGGQAVVDLAEGRIQAAMGTIASTQSSIKSGKLRALAVTGDRRVPTLPDVPTVKEAGVDGVTAALWMAVFAPAGTPADVVSRLNAEIGKILRKPDVQAGLESQGLDARASTPAELGALVASDIAKYRRVIEDAHITAE